MNYRSIEWQAADNSVRLLDQRQLPTRLVYLDYIDAAGLAVAIGDMVVRGAPAIGAAAAYGLAVALYHHDSDQLAALRQAYAAADAVLRCVRPTAVNLAWALDRMQAHVDANPVDTADAFRRQVLRQAHAIAEQDVAVNRRLAEHGLALMPQGASVIHHCNTGALATVDYGTALGVIRLAHEHGRAISVLVDETRPRLQGARLTCWELKQLGIPHTLIVDSAAGFYMRRGAVDLCLVGCDRIAANGDVANKIGSYNLALVAQAHDVPFYVAAPTSTIDMQTASGEQIDIEQRDATEVTHIGGEQLAPDDTTVGNPAFDVTPAACISAIITEKGIVRPPFAENLPGV